MNKELNVMRLLLQRLTFFIVFALGWTTVYAEEMVLPEESLFDSFEIRVIRPRYFSKTKRLHLGIQTESVVNQTFTYSFLTQVSGGFHFNNEWGLEAQGAYGFDKEKQDRKILLDDFQTHTRLSSLSQYWLVQALWSPMYGKYQLSEGWMIYSDTFVGLGGGQSWINHSYSHCKVGNINVRGKDSQKIAYPSFSIDLGQRYYFSQADAFRWDLVNMFPYVNTTDGECIDNGTVDRRLIHHIILQLGYVRFI